jgi:hypothetical protein
LVTPARLSGASSTALDDPNHRRSDGFASRTRARTRSLNVYAYVYRFAVYVDERRTGGESRRSQIRIFAGVATRRGPPPE